MPPFQVHEFRREEHVYINDAFSELLKDAILEGETANMIAALEAAIIAEHTPLWNSVIDGFGNHDPGARRATGKRPQWDCLHPGRPWAMRMSGEEFPVAELKRRVVDYFAGVRCRH